MDVLEGGYRYEIDARFDGCRTHVLRGSSSICGVSERLARRNTGKYKGITGTAAYTIVELHDTVGGRPALIVDHKATWEIK